MLNERIHREYKKWCFYAKLDPDLSNELKRLNDKEIEDAFYRDLSFGTGGLRGIIGAGTNRMNVYTVAKASQGLSNYLNRNFSTPSVAISFDSRIKSDLFSKIIAGVFSANGIHVFIYTQLMPTPLLSYAVRYLKCSAGVMITASHNPSKYNGYKVYGSDGCQITTEIAANIFSYIKVIDIFSDIRRNNFDAAMAAKKIEYINRQVYISFIKQIENQTPVADEKFNKNMSIVYSPLNGTGLKPVICILKETGYHNITIVKEQEIPDGNFPTCPCPNPEIREAMALGIEYAKRNSAELFLATDPDCDRCGIAIKEGSNYKLLTGNEIGILLFDFICSQRVKHKTMPPNSVMVKTIVTSDIGKQIADHYGVKTINVLTGFKFIGEQIGLLEKGGNEFDYIFGFEESYGYLSGSYVRDKDAVDAVFLICEMFSYYKSKGITLLDKLNELYRTYGYRLEVLHSYEFEGSFGFTKMQNIMEKYRQGINSFAGKKVIKVLDYSVGVDGLPKSNVLKFLLKGNSSIVVRPSGTEPKLKVYISISAKSNVSAHTLERKINNEVFNYMH